MYLLFLSCLAAGIGCGRFLPSRVSLVVSVIPVIVVTGALFFSSATRLFKTARLPLLFFCLGTLLMSMFCGSVRGGILPQLARSRAHVEVAGEAASAPLIDSAQASFYMSVKTVSSGRIKWKTAEKALIYLTDSRVAKAILTGKHIEVKGRLSLPLKGDALLEHGAASILRSESMTLDGAGPVYSAINSIRASMASSFRLAFPRKIAGFIEGVTMSKLDDADPETVSSLRSCGLSHLVAVSGLHVGSAAMLTLALLLVIGAGRRTRYVAATLVALCVMSIAGFRASSVRAAIMASLAFGAAMLGRDHDALAGISIAGIVILARSPATLFDRGLQFSFAAALAIIITVSMARKTGWLRAALSVCAAAQLGIIPLVLLGGEGVPVTATAANVVAVPLVGPILLTSWLVAIVTPLSRTLGRLIAIVPGALARVVMAVASFFSKVPTARPAGLFGFTVLLIYCGGLVLVIRAVRVKRPLFAPLVAVALSMSLVLVGFLPFPSLHSCETVTALDVEEGDAILIKDSTGAVVLVDGGPDERKILKKLQEKGVRRLDLAILSHPHADHMAGLAAVLREIPCGMLVDADLPTGSLPGRDDLLDVAANKKVRRVIAREGEQIEVSKRTSLEVLYPPAKGITKAANANDCSLVIMARVGEVGILLPGDIEATGQKALLAAHPDLSCGVLKVPHQGASNAATPELLDAADPALALISVEKGNKYGHPSARCLALLSERGVKVMRTDLEGDAEVSISGGRIGIAASSGGESLGIEESGQRYGAREPLLHLRGGGPSRGAVARAPEEPLLERSGPRLQHARHVRPGIRGTRHNRGGANGPAPVEQAARDSPGRRSAEQERAGEAGRIHGDGQPGDDTGPGRQIAGSLRERAAEEDRVLAAVQGRLA